MLINIISDITGKSVHVETTNQQWSVFDFRELEMLNSTEAYDVAIGNRNMSYYGKPKQAFVIKLNQDNPQHAADLKAWSKLDILQPMDVVVHAPWCDYRFLDCRVLETVSGSDGYFEITFSYTSGTAYGH